MIPHDRANSRTGELQPEILVVDDDDDFRELLIEHLQGTGRRVRAVTSGAEALATLARDGDDIALVLLDLRMPGLDGLQVCRELERSSARRRPVVLLTAEHDMRGAGASPLVVGVLLKPVDLDLLDAMLEAHTRCKV